MMVLSHRANAQCGRLGCSLCPFRTGTNPIMRALPSRSDDPSNTQSLFFSHWGLICQHEFIKRQLSLTICYVFIKKTLMTTWLICSLKPFLSFTTTGHILICLSITASLFVTGSVCPFILWHLNLDSVRAGPHLSQNLPHLSKERVLARQQ